MRLIQQAPAWQVHALLRILDIEYTSEFAPSSSALGMPLPVLVHDLTVVSTESDIVRYLWALFAAIVKQKSIETGSIDQEEIAAAFVQKRLIEPLGSYKLLRGVEQKLQFKTLPLGMNVVSYNWELIKSELKKLIR